MRFDQVRGYGFVAPDDGGDDIFLHVNDLLADKSAVVPGTTMEFEVEMGDRGLKASSARIVAAPQAGRDSGGYTPPAPGSSGAKDSDGFCDLLATADFVEEITELLLETEPTLTGAQIIQIRRQLTGIAEKYGWVENRPGRR